MVAEKIILSLITDAKSAQKDIEKVGEGTKEATKQTTLLSAATAKVKAGFAAAGKTAKILFGSIKAGLISTGLGAFVILVGSLIQYFKDSEEGASKLRQIMTQIGVVVGNVTDIFSNLGKAVYRLFTEGIDGFKESIGEAMDQVKNFGEQTKEEMKTANQLEKDRLALQKFEREANVEKAKTEAAIMELRLKARDIEAFTADERLKFMRQANQLADEQLEKDLHVANEKLRFQQIENSFSKSTQENLDAEAELEAQVFRIQRSNFSERKRMKSEEQAIVREVSAEEKRLLNEQLKLQQELMDLEAKRIDDLTLAANKLLDDYYQTLLDAETREINAVIDKYFTTIELKKKEGEDVTALEEAQQAEMQKIREKYAGLKKNTDDSNTTSTKLSTEAALSLTANAFGNISTFAAEGTATFKKLKSAETAITTASAAINAYNSLVGTPFIGPVIAPLAAAAAVAVGAEQIRAINAVDVKASRGAYIRGYGSETSDSIPARLSKGEVVINAKSARRFRPLLSDINVAGGGVAFARGGATEPDIRNSANFMQPSTIKAFVLTDEMTNSQARLSRIRRKASI